MQKIVFIFYRHRNKPSQLYHSGIFLKYTLKIHILSQTLKQNLNGRSEERTDGRKNARTDGKMILIHPCHISYGV